mmetsp:Transcript_32337/g.89355  ORF Transcript_32337/g.89355 Transcript_32337/m.89355 type:complete len:250 (-) Transcript_32337:1261-2010(-)
MGTEVMERSILGETIRDGIDTECPTERMDVEAVSGCDVAVTRGYDVDVGVSATDGVATSIGKVRSNDDVCAVKAWRHVAEVSPVKLPELKGDVRSMTSTDPGEAWRARSGVLFRSTEPTEFWRIPASWEQDALSCRLCGPTLGQLIGVRDVSTADVDVLSAVSCPGGTSSRCLMPTSSSRSIYCIFTLGMTFVTSSTNGMGSSLTTSTSRTWGTSTARSSMRTCGTSTTRSTTRVEYWGTCLRTTSVLG